ncbi:MAG: DUF4292 domain-containing protein [Bacteroidaceae bacterium]|nr:DUF4292 domain-containing protein [Bacteroidaceae bacterium]
MKKIIFSIIAALTLASCGTTKKAESGSTTATNTPNQSVQTVTSASLLQKIKDNAVTNNCIVADLDFTMSSGSRNISVGGSLQMKKDDVIRIRLVALGIMEVGRLEFTKDYVLIQDKFHKKYVQEDYNKVSFLKDNGLDFYALQALLWNQLYIPGKGELNKSDLKEFSVQPISGKEQSNIMLNRSSFTFKWLANNQTNLLEDVNVDYKSQSHGSTNVNCKYSKFVKMGAKQFPTDIQLSLQTTAIKPAKTLKLGFALDDIKNSEKWETRTTPSKKYEKISVDEMLNLLMSISK